MTSREKFEAWYLENWGHTEDDHETLFERDPDSDEEYYRLGVRMAHGAWQASESASQQKLTDMAVQLANAESKCRELVAELSAVDKIHNEAVFITDENYEQSPPEVQKMIRSLAVLQIPAYASFLSEVRAQGVESYAEQLKSEADRAEETGWEDAAKFLRSESEKVLAFAAQLRKGGEA